MLTEKEKEKSIALILEKGLKPKPSLRASLQEIFESLGFRYAFWGINDCLFLTVMIVLIGGLVFTSFLGVIKEAYILSCLFTLSPFIYMLLYLLSLWKENSSKTYEIKMACRYTLRHLTVFRMLCFSSMAILGNLIFSLAVFYCFDDFLFIRLLMVSLCGLFLYGAGMMFILMLSSNPWVHTFFSLGWMLANILLIGLLESKIERFLLDLPLLAFFVFLTAAVFIYLKEISVYLKKKGVENRC